MRWRYRAIPSLSRLEPDQSRLARVARVGRFEVPSADARWKWDRRARSAKKCGNAARAKIARRTRVRSGKYAEGGKALVPRLLFVLHHPEFGGPHNQALQLNQPLLARGWQTLVVLPQDAERSSARLAGAGVEVLRMPLCRLRRSLDPAVQFRWGARFFSDVGAIRGVIHSRQIDLVMLCGLANAQAAIAGRLAEVPVVWQIVDTRSPMVLRRLMMPLVRSLAGAVLSTGVSVAAAHPGANRLGSRLVPFFPPVDTQRFVGDQAKRQKARSALGLRPGAVIVGNVGNVNPQKGHGTFIRAAALLRKKSLGDVQFVILGATYAHRAAYTELLIREAEALGLVSGKDLIWRDPGDQVHELACAFDIFWLTSEPRSEGIPTVVEEAMAMQLPVVSANVGGVSELIEDGVSGFLVAPRNAQAIAEITLRLIRDENLRHTIGACARRRALMVADIEVCADAHLAAFARAAGDRSARPSMPAPTGARVR